MKDTDDGTAVRELRSGPAQAHWLTKAAPGKVQPGNPVEWSKRFPSSSRCLLTSMLSTFPLGTVSEPTYRATPTMWWLLNRTATASVSPTHWGSSSAARIFLGNTRVVGNNGMDWFDLDKESLDRETKQPEGGAQQSETVGPSLSRSSRTGNPLFDRRRRSQTDAGHFPGPDPHARI